MTAPRGKPYQQLVAEVVRAFDSGAMVTDGVWVEGPDGRLDMDVAIRGQIDGLPVLAVIECKDFNLESTGKVGREYVDALDSKRHDLGSSITMICSNSGFTRDALRKAHRKRIGMISVLRRGDDRVKAIINKEILLRRIRFGEWQFTYHGSGDIASELNNAGIHQIRFERRSLGMWLQHRALEAAKANPSLSERRRVCFRFKEPLSFDCKGTTLVFRAVEIEFIYTTEWLSQTVRLDARLGMYDYLRGRVSLSAGDNEYVIEGINWETAELCDPPDPTDMPLRGLIPGEIDVGLTMAEGMNLETALELPDLDSHVVPEDLERSMRLHG